MGNIPFNKINVFPSSNSTTHGKITAEDNLRDITTKMKLLNYIVSGLAITKSGSNINIADGSCVINGYLITIEAFSVVYTASSNVWIKIGYDANDLIDTIVDPNDTTKIKGVEVTFTDPSGDDSKYLKIGELDASGNPVSTFVPNYFPLSSNNISVVDSNGNLTNQSLTDYVNVEATGEYLSKTKDDTKKGNVVFNNTNDNKTVTIDSSGVTFKDNTTKLLEVKGGTIASDGNVSLTANGNVSETASQITLTVNGMSVVLKTEGGQNKIVIGNVTLTIGADQVDISCPSTVNISASNTNITGNLTVDGTIRGTKVYGAVFN